MLVDVSGSDAHSVTLAWGSTSCCLECRSHGNSYVDLEMDWIALHISAVPRG